MNVQFIPGKIFLQIEGCAFQIVAKASGWAANLTQRK